MTDHNKEISDASHDEMIRFATSAVVHNINTIMEMITTRIGDCEDVEAVNIGAAVGDFCIVLDKCHASVLAFLGGYEEENVAGLHKTSIEGQERALKELLEIHKTATAKEGKPN